MRKDWVALFLDTLHERRSDDPYDRARAGAQQHEVLADAGEELRQTNEVTRAALRDIEELDERMRQLPFGDNYHVWLRGRKESQIKSVR